MLKTLDICLIAVMLGVTGWTYGVKHQAEEIETELARIEREISSEKDTIAILSADWTLLDQPSRLQTLYDAYAEELGLQPLAPTQVAASDELPAPPVRPDADEAGRSDVVASNVHNGVE